MTDHPTIKVTRDLRAIVELTGRLEAQAIALADDQLMPGGLAMVALAGAAAPSAYAEALDDAEQRALAVVLAAGLDPRTAVMPEVYEDDWEPPLQTLLFWSEEWRTLHDMPFVPSKGRPRQSEATEANFLLWALDWAWRNERRWEDFAADIKAARKRLEAILAAGTATERSRVVCPDCDDAPRLIKVWAPAYIAGWRCCVCSTTLPETLECEECRHRYEPRGGRCTNRVGPKDDRHVCGGKLQPTIELDHCPNPECWTAAPPEPVQVSDSGADQWKCPACRHRFGAESLRDAYAKQLRSAGAARWVTLADALSIMRRQGWREHTVRRWVSEGRIESKAVEYENGTRGPRLVWWPDAWRAHLAHKREREQARRYALELGQRRAYCAVVHGEECWVPGRGCSKTLAKTTSV